MKKLLSVIILGAGIIGCSVEPIDSSEQLLTADGKIKLQQVETSMSLEVEEICFGDQPTFVFEFPQNYNGPHETDTRIKIQIETYPGSEEWVEFADLSYEGAGPENYTYDGALFEEGNYSFRANFLGQGGGPGHNVLLEVVDCTECEETFSYIDNEDGTYTFTYIPAEDMSDAEVVFTFAQGVSVSGLEDWGQNGVTKQNSMTFEACEEYVWTVGLETNCKGVGQPNANLWTDFKINYESKKNEATPNIVQSCN